MPKAGDTILWHAAAGGVGLIACQWAKALGVQPHRHGELGREGEARARARRRAHHHLYQGRLRRARERDHRRQEGPGGVRLGGQGHLPEVARLPAAARPAGALRQLVRPGGRAQHGAARRQGLALRDAPYARSATRRSATSWSPRRRSSSTWCSPARSRSARASSTRSRTRRRRTATSRRRKTTGSTDPRSVAGTPPRPVAAAAGQV